MVSKRGGERLCKLVDHGALIYIEKLLRVLFQGVCLRINVGTSTAQVKNRLDVHQQRAPYLEVKKSQEMSGQVNNTANISLNPYIIVEWFD